MKSGVALEVELLAIVTDKYESWCVSLCTESLMMAGHNPLIFDSQVLLPQFSFVAWYSRPSGIFLVLSRALMIHCPWSRQSALASLAILWNS